MEILHKIQEFFKSISPFVLGAIIFVLIGVLGFGLGRLSAREDSSSKITLKEGTLITDNCPAFTDTLNLSTAEASSDTEEGEVADSGLLVGSKNSDKYHYPWCPGALRIKDENKVWFSSVEDARNAGYSPAGNCKGLE